MLFLGDDWAEAHHDVEIVDAEGRLLARRRLPEGVEGLSRLHAMVADHLGDDHADADPARVLVGIETDRGPWVQALMTAGYTVYAVNPLQVARYRERHAVSGAKSDPGDAHVLAELVRLDRAPHRPIAGDSAVAEHVKVLARTPSRAGLVKAAADQHAALDAAGVLPGRAGRVRGRPGRPGRPGGADDRALTRAGTGAVTEPDRRGVAPGRAPSQPRGQAGPA